MDFRMRGEYTLCFHKLPMVLLTTNKTFFSYFKTWYKNTHDGEFFKGSDISPESLHKIKSFRYLSKLKGRVF